MISIFSRILTSLQTFNAGVCAILLYLSAAGLILMTLIIGWQVFGRYILNDSPAWSESLALLLLLYFAIFAAAVGVRERFHLGIVFLVEKMPADLAAIIRVVSSGIVGFFGFYMMVSGIELAGYTMDHIIPTLNISRAAAYLPFVISGFLIVLFSLEHVLAGLLCQRGE